MFGAEEHDWMAPYESVPHVSTMHYEDVQGTQRPRATKAVKGATVYKGAKGVAYPKGVKAATVYKGVKGTKAVKGVKGIRGGGNPWQKAAAYVHTPEYRHAAGYAPLRGYGAYGDADVPYTTSHGAQATAHMTQQSQCGDAFGVQQALTDIGYPVAVDGIIGPQTFAALDAFAAANGISYPHGSYPTGQLCQALEDQWTAQHGPPVTPVPPSPASPNPNTGIVDSTKTWWTNLPTASKYLVAGTGAVAAALVIAALVKTPKTAHGHG